MVSNSAKTGKKNRLILFAAIIIIIIAAVTVLVSVMRQSVKSSVHSERSEFLGRLTESCSLIINDNIDHAQSMMDMISDNAEKDMQHYQSLGQYIDEMKTRSGYKDQMFFFVDAEGKYYSSDGQFGKVIDRTYYTASSEAKLSYIASLPHLDPSKAYLVFRNRFSKPIHVMTQKGEKDIIYCGVLFDIDALNEIVSGEFAGRTNTFIYDDTTGVMLYKNFGIKLLIDGFNLYPKFSACKILYGNKAEDIEQACRDQKTVVAAIEIDGQEYYFCSAPISHLDWSVAFIIQSEYLNDVSGNALGRIILYVTLIVVILGAAMVLLFIFWYRNAISQKSITEITKLNEELDKATKAKSEFLSNMSHDIRTPINGIMGMTAIAKGVEGNPDRTKECLDKIDGASHHLLTLINDVLDMSRIERGKIEISHVPMDIRTVCDNCSSIIRGQMTGRNLELITEIDCQHPRILGDDLHLRQVFINILGNAVKFTKDGGKIWLRCKELESDDKRTTLAFEIEDTGIGMKPEFLDKIFDAFSQDEGGARSIYKGTGLGMAITKQLTELMGGTIEVESELGKGSKFTVTMPFEINTEEDEAEEISSEDTDISGVKVLLVEDNMLNMEIAMELLEPTGVVITTAGDGQQAVDMFKDSAPGSFDVILMDVMMPVMNGLDATRAIRALDREDARTIPILAMTANAFDSDIKATKEAGMNAHLSKPIIIEDVVKTIARFVRKQGGAE